MSRYLMPLCLTFIWATAGFSAPAKLSPAVNEYNALADKFRTRGEYDKALNYAKQGLLW